MTYRYISIGLSLGGTSGIVSYLHDRCAQKFNMTLGPDAVPFDGEVPSNVKCPWCGKSLKEAETLDGG